MGGLVLGLFNLWHGTREQARLRQRELRAELRNKLREIRAECQQALEIIKQGDNLEDRPPAGLANARTDLKRMTEDLNSPGNRRIELLISALNIVKYGWPNSARISLVSDNSEQAARRRIAAETELRADLERALQVISDLLTTLRRIDNGNVWVYYWNLP